METLRILVIYMLVSIVTSTSNIKLFVGPRQNETGRYLYKNDTKDMTSSKSRVVYKHCLYCDNNVAFYNTTMNILHQEEKCITNNLNIDEDNRPKYEKDNNLFPYCKLGDVPVCDPPPHRENIQKCDRGYSNTLFSMYFSCLISNGKSGTVLSEFYCNENLQWQFLRNYQEETVITERMPEEITINVTMATRTTPETEYTTNEYQRVSSRLKETETDNTIVFLVAIILAVVLAVLAIIMGVILFRYVYKRGETLSGQRSTVLHQHPSTFYPAINPLLKSNGKEYMSPEGAVLIRSSSRNTSNGSCQTDLEAGQLLSSLNTGVQSSEGSPNILGRESPVGEENFPVQVTQNENERENPNMPPVFDLNTNRSLDPEIISMSKEQNQSHVSGGSQFGSQHNCKSSEKFHRVNSGTEDQRQEPVGKVSKPRYEETLEENSQITEPKRVVSVERMDIRGTENDESFEIDPVPDSGINMNIRWEPCRMQDLKQ